MGEELNEILRLWSTPLILGMSVGKRSTKPGVDAGGSLEEGTADNISR